MDCEHYYQMAGENYCKQTDTAVTYVMLYCLNCGGTKEIISKDQR